MGTLSQWCLLSLLAAVGGHAEQYNLSVIYSDDQAEQPQDDLSGSGDQAEQHNLTFMLITSFGQYGFNSSGQIPAVDMALEDINSNPQVLPGYSLMYDTLRDSQVSLGLQLKTKR